MIWRYNKLSFVILKTENWKLRFEITETATCAPKRKKWYTIEGRRISVPRKGLNIMRKADGTVKKVMVK